MRTAKEIFTIRLALKILIRIALPCFVVAFICYLVYQPDQFGGLVSLFTGNAEGKGPEFVWTIFNVAHIAMWVFIGLAGAVLITKIVLLIVDGIRGLIWNIRWNKEWKKEHINKKELKDGK